LSLNAALVVAVQQICMVACLLQYDHLTSWRLSFHNERVEAVWTGSCP